MSCGCEINAAIVCVCGFTNSDKFTLQTSELQDFSNSFQL